LHDTPLHFLEEPVDLVVAHAKVSREGPKVVNLAFTRGPEPAEDLHLNGVVIGAIGTQWLAHRRDARV
jgi:hypothetical protein